MSTIYRAPIVLILYFFVFPYAVLADNLEKEVQEFSYLSCDGMELVQEQGATRLAQVQENYSKLRTFRVLFRQHSFLAALDSNEQSSGFIRYMSPGSMRWTYQKPEEQEFLIHDKSFYFYQAQDQQVLVQSLDDVLTSDLPLSFLFGMGNLSEDFSLVSTCKEQKGLVFVLQPVISKEQASFKQLLIQSNNEFLPAVIQVHHIGGNVTAIELFNYESDVHLERSDFVLDVPKGVDIIDKR